MLNYFITGLLLILAYTPNTTFGASEPKSNENLLAKIKSTPQAHEWFPQASVKKEAILKTSSLKTGDIFRGIVSLAEPRHNPAELTLLIRNITSTGATESEFEIEATVVMKIGTMNTTYGVHGVYVPSCQQMNLYEIQDLPAASVPFSTGTLINNVIFEPVGLAGKFTDDGNTIKCAIAYNGNASLERMTNIPDKFAETITAKSSKNPHHNANIKPF